MNIYTKHAKQKSLLRLSGRNKPSANEYWSILKKFYGERQLNRKDLSKMRKNILAVKT